MHESVFITFFKNSLHVDVMLARRNGERVSSSVCRIQQLLIHINLVFYQSKCVLGRLPVEGALKVAGHGMGQILHRTTL